MASIALLHLQNHEPHPKDKYPHKNSINMRCALVRAIGIIKETFRIGPECLFSKASRCARTPGHVVYLISWEAAVELSMKGSPSMLKQTLRYVRYAIVTLTSIGFVLSQN
jgi:hypothetical protein